MKLQKIFSLTLLVFLTPFLSAESISVEELADRLVNGPVPFLIDVRRSHEYTESHIPNAVSIPQSMLRSRRLPPIGEVVVYGDGMGRTDMDAVLAVLKEKPGIQPLVLEGGFASWNTRSGINTSAPGLREQKTPHITYEELAVKGGEGVVIFDLRKSRGNASGQVRLQDHFPRARLQSGSPYALLKAEEKPQVSSAATAGRANEKGNNPFLRNKPVDSSELIVLVDDDHESASRMAHRLKSAGFERVVVLAGGEMIMQFEGRPGLERRGRGSVKINSSEELELIEGAAGENP